VREECSSSGDALARRRSGRDGSRIGVSTCVGRPPQSAKFDRTRDEANEILRLIRISNIMIGRFEFWVCLFALGIGSAVMASRDEVSAVVGLDSGGFD